MSVRFALIATLLVSVAAPAFAQDNSATTAAPAAPPVKEKKICQSDVDTGSIMAHRTCHTKSEWAEINKENEKNNDQFNDANRRHSGGFGH
jgi:predicted transglutaminase-like cysteine proteinase